MYRKLEKVAAKVLLLDCIVTQTMGNGIAVILLHINETKFDKQLSTRGISRTAYLGRLIHILSDMIGLALIEEDGGDDEESCVFDEEESSRSDTHDSISSRESAESDMIESDEFGVQESEFESSDCPVAERYEDVRNSNGLGDSVDSTAYYYGSEDEQNMHTEFESKTNGFQVTEKSKDERNEYDMQRPEGERKDTAESGHFCDMYSEPEPSDCQMDEEYCSKDEMDTKDVHCG